MVTKRSLGATMLLLGLAFVGAFHAVAAYFFDTGLELIGVALAAVSLLGVLLVNVPADETDGATAGEKAESRSAADVGSNEDTDSGPTSDVGDE